MTLEGLEQPEQADRRYRRLRFIAGVQRERVLCGGQVPVGRRGPADEGAGTGC